MPDNVFFRLPFAKIEETEIGKTFSDNWISNADVLSFSHSLSLES